MNQHTTTRSQSLFRQPRLLLIEDNLDQQRLIRTVLQAVMPEIELWTAASPEEALTQLAECIRLGSPLPRLILLDIYLPECEMGWTLLRHLKEPASTFRLIPVTLLTQSGKPDDIRTAYELGANSYIVKPSDYPQWLAYFKSLQRYWMQTVTLPPT